MNIVCICPCVTIIIDSNGYYSDSVDETPEDVLMELIARFGQTILRARDDMEK